MDARYWETRYQTQDMPWEKGAPSPGLIQWFSEHPQLPPATVVVPGCGTGHDARVWAMAGFETYGIDIAPSAIRLAFEKSQGIGVDHLHFLQADFLTDPPPRKFDWLFEHTLFCAIDPSRRDDYVQAALRWLTPRAQLLAVHYLIPDRDGPPFGTTREEIVARFSPHFDLIQDWVPPSYPNRVGLERMFWWQRRQGGGA